MRGRIIIIVIVVIVVRTMIESGTAEDILLG
jgi:hypothetical protein